MAKLVRLKPYDPKKGHVIRRYTAFAIRFEEARGWYKVSDEVATYLGTVHQVPGDEDSPLAFDVCTEEEAQRLEVAEKKKAEERARAAEPNVAQPHDVSVKSADLTTADVAPARSSRAEARAARRA
jgi:uncharacterized protein YdbL (DUF1318 family)